MLKNLKRTAKRFTQELKLYRAILRDPRTPFFPKVLLASAIAYAVSPIDLIPDFIPVLGHLDDIVMVPLLVFLALKATPRPLILEHRRRMFARRRNQGNFPTAR